jgi:hypothetical protein
MPPSQSSDRAASAARIINNPAAYKVCEGCDSIVGASTTLCPNCHSYRFEPSAERVIQQARILGSREQKSVTAGDLG